MFSASPTIQEPGNMRLSLKRERGQRGKTVLNSLVFLTCDLPNSPTVQQSRSAPSLRSNWNLLPCSCRDIVYMFLEHMNELSNLDHNHSPFLTYIQLLFSVTEPHWLFLNIFNVRLLPSGNDNHAISSDFINTPPQVLVLFPQVASVSLSSSPDITHTLGKLMVSPPPPPATAFSRKAACWAYLHH